MTTQSIIAVLFLVIILTAALLTIRWVYEKGWVDATLVRDQARSLGNNLLTGSALGFAAVTVVDDSQALFLTCVVTALTAAGAALIVLGCHKPDQQ